MRTIMALITIIFVMLAVLYVVLVENNILIEGNIVISLLSSVWLIFAVAIFVYNLNIIYDDVIENKTTFIN